MIQSNISVGTNNDLLLHFVHICINQPMNKCGGGFTLWF